MEHNTRILIVDDNESIHEDFRKVLIHEQNEEHAALDDLEVELFGTDGDVPKSKTSNDSLEYEVNSALQGQEALAIVDKAAQEGRPYTLIFMDVRMPPGWDGIETISRIWSKHPYIEMVLCTAYSDYTWDDIVEKLGSSDKLLFLRKPFDAIAVQQMALSLVKKWNLGEQARNYVKNLEQEVQQRTLQLKELLTELETKNAELANSNDQLKHAALHDALTGLPNRILFHDRLEQAIKLATRNKTQFAVAMMDLNEFKEINDRRGHLTGDYVLKTVADRIQKTLRDSDTVARLGGDEFAFVLPTVARESPDAVLKKIMSAFKDPITMGSNGEKINVGASIGITLYPDHGTNVDTLIGRADSAMYAAKRDGSDICIYSENADEAATGQAIRLFVNGSG
ncbi:MAG: diguanylate cyclase, partial [Gammaproteobacteria bacterium]|nr:diguanylate cyclase [Gammaproteobacteria bacterium]